MVKGPQPPCARANPYQKPLRWKQIAHGMILNRNLGETIKFGKREKTEVLLSESFDVKILKRSDQLKNEEENGDGGSGMMADGFSQSMDDKSYSGKVEVLTQTKGMVARSGMVLGCEMGQVENKATEMVTYAMVPLKVQKVCENILSACRSLSTP
ncbi:hypothetical protein Ddye_005461 [Dipteronia dyeriana]|uniref:Uncharacterized protein n=1 Tax=Dipteronia dyeriana TaxID=168575 RepID=A0AAD9XH58_9ROSI|nr:hypothetical protein Ddye_005461 [Dipteronia dyeriana]